MALRKEALDAAGGIQVNRIGSDFNLGKRIALAGYQVELSSLVLDSDTGNETLRSLWEREVRWARTIRYNRGPIYYTQLFCFGSVLVLPLLVFSGGAWWSVWLSVLCVLSYLTQITLSLVLIGGITLSHWAWITPFRVVLNMAVWIAGGVGNTVRWRGRSLRISQDGIITVHK